MEAALRQRIREEIDRQARERRQAFLDELAVGVCSACGCDHDHRTIGCKRCSDRHLKLARRADPAFRALEQAGQKRRRRARAAA